MPRDKDLMSEAALESFTKAAGMLVTDLRREMTTAGAMTDVAQ
jgi:hypothetical protein